MRVVIVGAGASGLACAHALHANGWQVTIIDRQPGLMPGGFMIDFFGPGFGAAQRLGLLEAMRERGRVFSRVVYLDEHNRERAALEVERITQAAGGRYFSILRPQITAALAGILPDGVDLRFGHTLTELTSDPGGVTATAVDIRGNATRLRADLLIGADGVHSAVRQLLWGDEEHYLRQLGFRAGSYTYRDPALARRLATTGVLTDSLDCQVGMYGVDDETVAVLLVERTEQTEHPVRLAEHWQQRLAGLSPLSDRVLSHVPDRMYIDTVAQTVVPSWCNGRVLLTGDAAHCVSFLAGQGVSMAIWGAELLADQVADGSDLDAALGRYESGFRPKVEAVQRSGRAAAATFCPSNRFERWVRRAVLRISALPGANRLAARQLAGPAAG